jgi:hypothetical protein
MDQKDNSYKRFKITLIPLPFSHEWEKGAIPAGSELPSPTCGRGGSGGEGKEGKTLRSELHQKFMNRSDYRINMIKCLKKNKIFLKSGQGSELFQ